MPLENEEIIQGRAKVAQYNRTALTLFAVAKLLGILGIILSFAQCFIIGWVALASSMLCLVISIYLCVSTMNLTHDLDKIDPPAIKEHYHG